MLSQHNWVEYGLLINLSLSCVSFRLSLVWGLWLWLGLVLVGRVLCVVAVSCPSFGPWADNGAGTCSWAGFWCHCFSTFVLSLCCCCLVPLFWAVGGQWRWDLLLGWFLVSLFFHVRAVSVVVAVLIPKRKTQYHYEYLDKDKTCFTRE